ncbi:ribonuclease H-like domain-containing protein [Tanacetum coccineum]
MSAHDDFSLHDDEELSLHDDASLAGSLPASNKGDAPAKPPQIITTNTLSNIKLPVLQKDDYDTWAMEMEHYLEYIDNEVWKVIQNGNSKKRVTKGKDGVYRVLPPTTQEEQFADEKERKARTLLLMAVPKDHLRRFHGMDDAKEIWAAIKTRFGGNANSKKMQKAVLKQQFEAFTISSKESLEKGYDRFQKLLSQLEALGAGVSDEDANHKFLRSLPPAWDSLAMTMRTKKNIDTLSIDDLYNNLSVFEQDIQKTSSSSLASDNVAFISQAKASSSKHKPSQSSGSYSSYTTSSSKAKPTATPGLADEVIHSFLATNADDVDLIHEDLDQIDDLDLEEMDINWQIAMTAIKIKKFYKKTGRRPRVDGKMHVAFDKRKVECFNCHNTGHFARECKFKGSKEGSRQEAGRGQDFKPVRTEKEALMTIDEGQINWVEQTTDEELNHALMAFTVNNEVSMCSKLCLDSYNALLYHIVPHIRMDIDVSQYLPQDIYNLVNHNEDAKKIWDRVKLLLQGSELSLQERESKLYDDFDTFTSIPGETVHSYYMRFAQLINDMYTIGMTMKPLQVNTNFVNHLQPDWNKFVTDVKLAKYMHTTNFDHLYAHQRQHEAHANEVRLSRQRQGVVGQARVVICYNYQEEGHFARQCTKPKRPKNSAWFKEKMLLTEALESGAYLDPEQFAFLADNGDTVIPAQASQEIPTLATFQTDDLDAFDSDCDDIPSAKAVLMANLSSYDLDVLLEVIVDRNAKVADFGKQIHSLKLQLNATVESHKTLSKTVECMIKESKLKEDKYLDEFIDLQKKNKSLDNVVYKMARWKVPALYDGNNIVKTHVALSVTDSGETLKLAEESRLKMLAKQNDPSLKEKKVNIAPVDYVALNKLYEHFVPQKQLSAEHAFWLPISQHVSVKTQVQSEPVLEKEIPRELPSIRAFEKDVKPFAQTLKEYFRMFEHGLNKELKEMKSVFTQMETEVAKCSVDKKYFEIEKKELSLDNDRLLEHIICQDVMNIVMLVNDHSDNVLPANNNSLKHDNSALELFKHENDRLMKLLISQDLVHTTVNSLAGISDYKSMQQSFVDEYNETLALKAKLAKKNDMIEKNNMAANVDYLKHTQENVDILHEIVKHARNLRPLDSDLAFACKFVTRIQELLVYVSATCPSSKHVSDKLVVVTPMNMTRKVSDYLNDVHARVKSKSVKSRSAKSKKKKMWKPTGPKEYWELHSGDARIGAPGRAAKLLLQLLAWNYSNALRLKLACDLGKSKKSTHKPKADDSNQEKLYLLHMDICGPMHVENINGKKYILVIVDDYSRFTLVKFFRSNDEAPEVIIKCLKKIQVRMNATVCNVRTDNGTEFVNQTLLEYYENFGISHQTSVAHTL